MNWKLTVSSAPSPAAAVDSARKAHATLTAGQGKHQTEQGERDKGLPADVEALANSAIRAVEMLAADVFARDEDGNPTGTISAVVTGTTDGVTVKVERD